MLGKEFLDVFETAPLPISIDVNLEAGYVSSDSLAVVSSALADSPLPPLPVFQGTSYLRRYEILCERLVLERDYTATALLVSDSKTASVRDGGESVGAMNFFKSLYSYLSARS